MSRQDQIIQRASFNALVDAGVYSADFDHPRQLKDFVASTVAENALCRAGERPTQVLDCGCGTGAWLAYLGTLFEKAARDGDFFGFDLSDRMIEVARNKLAGQIDATHIQRGDLLEEAAYRFDGVGNGFDLIFVFDAIQQLPPSRQYEACELMVEQLAPGGVMLVFDHDKSSPYGRKMARKKFVTRYLGIPLVPRYYCRAKYPPLNKFAERLTRRKGLSANVRVAGDCPKMALVINKEERS